MVRRVRADRERQPMAIHNRHDFHAFSALRWSDFRPATFSHNERRIDEAFFFIQRAFVAKLMLLRKMLPNALPLSPVSQIIPHL